MPRSVRRLVVSRRERSSKLASHGLSAGVDDVSGRRTYGSRATLAQRGLYGCRMEFSISKASIGGQFAAVRRLFGAYQREVTTFASEAEVCA